MAKETLADTQTLPRDIATLLNRWALEPDVFAQLLARPDWLLDGSHLRPLGYRAGGRGDARGDGCTGAGGAAQGGCMAQPATWPHDRLPQYRSRLVQPMEDWRTGVTVPDVVARNEALLEKTL